MTVESQVVPSNTYLEGNFAPTHQETEQPCLNVQGEIPAELKGCFLRIGPNPQYVKDIKSYHWFDGDGMIHEIEFDSGNATYRNKWIQTKGFKIEQEEGKALWNGINSPPDFSNPHGPMKNPANTAFVWNANRLLALWEGGEPHEVKLPSLETVGAETFNNKLMGYPYSAHPKVDPETGEMIACGYFMAAAPFVKHFVINKDGEMVKETPIDIPKGVMMHDCAITKNYTVIMDLPLTFDLPRAMKGKKPIQWEPDNGARIGVLPRHADGSEVAWFDVEPGMVFHSMNAYEDGDEIVLDACRSIQTTMLQEDSDPDLDYAFPHQWRLNLKTGEVKETKFSEISCEFPRINENYQGRQYRYCWASRFARTPQPLFNAFVKFDRETGEEWVYELGEGRYMGEAVFAPKEGSDKEDDGWVIGFVRDENKEVSECVIMDASDYTKGPVAVITMPTRVPYGFHAGWVGGAQLAQQR
ncbi:MAG: carotenoid oxygenase family protein [Pseudomonadales bacterium]|nr:carotenoid oxygenase family protein [Pseudomonadales bacterium]